MSFILLEIQLCFCVFYSNYNLVYNSRLKIHKRLRKIIYNFRWQILINFSTYFMSSGSFVRLLSICMCLLYISQVLGFKVLLEVMEAVQLAIINMLSCVVMYKTSRYMCKDVINLTNFYMSTKRK